MGKCIKTKQAERLSCWREFILTLPAGIFIKVVVAGNEGKNFSWLVEMKSLLYYIQSEKEITHNSQDIFPDILFLSEL